MLSFKSEWKISGIQYNDVNADNKWSDLIDNQYLW